MGKSIKRQVPWTKTLLEDFISEGLLTNTEEKILRTRISGWTIIQQSLEFGISTSVIQKNIKTLKMKYDYLHKLYPKRFPQRIEDKDKVDEVYDGKIKDPLADVYLE